MVRRGKSSRKSKKVTSDGDGKMINLLTQILEQTTLQSPSKPPVVRDIKAMHVRRNQTMTFRRSTGAGTISVGTTAPATTGGIQIALSSLPDYTEFTNLFDNYRFLCLAVTFQPAKAASYVQIPGADNFYTAIDYDDSSPVTASLLSEYDSYQVTQVGQCVTRTLAPKWAVGAYSGAFSSFAQSKGWVDCASPGVLWYGCKWAIDPSAATGNIITYDIQLDLVLQFRNSR